MIGRTLAGYEITALLGEGGMGTVYEARDPATGERVAIKLCHPDLTRDRKLLRRFQEEARALSRLEHDHLVRVRRVGRDADQYYHVMDFVEGRTLEQVMASRGPLPVDRAVELLAQIMSALDVVHRAGIVHRDVKPANVMLTPQGRAVLMDFGVAKSWDRETLTTLGSILGTPEYMAPEQAQGGPVDGRADIYALGAVLYHMLAGEPPFRGDSSIAIIRRHIEEPVPSVRAKRSDLPDDVDRIIGRAMAKSADERYAGMADMARDLSALHPTDALTPILQGDRPVAPRNLPRTVALMAAPATRALAALAEAGQAGRSRRLWVAAAAALLLVAAVAWWLIRGGSTRYLPPLKQRTRDAAHAAPENPAESGPALRAAGKAFPRFRRGLRVLVECTDGSRFRGRWVGMTRTAEGRVRLTFRRGRAKMLGWWEADVARSVDEPRTEHKRGITSP